MWVGVWLDLKLTRCIKKKFFLVSDLFIMVKWLLIGTWPSDMKGLNPVPRMGPCPAMILRDWTKLDEMGLAQRHAEGLNPVKMRGLAQRYWLRDLTQYDDGDLAQRWDRDLTQLDRGDLAQRYCCYLLWAIELLVITMFLWVCDVILNRVYAKAYNCKCDVHRIESLPYT